MRSTGRFRIGLRGLITLVAVMAVFLAIPDHLKRRSDRFAAMALRYQYSNKNLVVWPTRYGNEFMYHALGYLYPNERPGRKKYRLHREAMVEKYVYASRYPWLPVLPDPPSPGLSAEDFRTPPRSLWSELSESLEVEPGR